MKLLVTGSSGAIGSALLSRLKDSEYDVVGVDVEPNQWGFDIQTLHRDLRKDVSLPNADVIVHLAAHSQVQPMIEDPSLAIENIRMTERVLEHADEIDAHVILASSREIYGSAIRPSEDSVTGEVTNPYGASKIGSESIASAYANCMDVNVTTLRFANVYGPYDLNPRVVPTFITLGMDGKELTVYDDSKLIDFIYIDDVITALIETIEGRDAFAGETITVGSGSGTPLSELAEIVVDWIDECPGYTTEPNRTGDTEKFVASIEKAQALLGFDPQSLSEGMKETIDWYRTRPHARSSVRKSVEEFDSSKSK